MTAASDVGAMTFAASTHAASGPHAAGHRSIRSSVAAAIAAGNAPMTGTRFPFKDNSPSATVLATSSRGNISSAVNRAIAMDRSKCEPSLGRFAGDRLIVIFLDGNAMAMWLSAALTRSRASDTALSGNPTIAKPGMPGVTAHWTSTILASTPSKATV